MHGHSRFRRLKPSSVLHLLADTRTCPLYNSRQGWNSDRAGCSSRVWDPLHGSKRQGRYKREGRFHVRCDKSCRRQNHPPSSGSARGHNVEQEEIIPNFPPSGGVFFLPVYLDGIKVGVVHKQKHWAHEKEDCSAEPPPPVDRN